MSNKKLTPKDLRYHKDTLIAMGFKVMYDTPSVEPNDGIGFQMILENGNVVCVMENPFNNCDWGISFGQSLDDLGDIWGISEISEIIPYIVTCLLDPWLKENS